MADYRLSAKLIKRSNGQSAVASAAYRAGARLVDERTGEVHDYGRKGGVLHSEVMTPEATPEWQKDRAQLWNAVEAVERRKDAQLAREVQLSLPHELTDGQRMELVRGFVADQFVSRGMIADLAIHAPSDKGDMRNHHAHVMLTMRELTGDGFGQKQRSWNSPELLNEWREDWANHQNRALERYGHAARVDHRSYEAQGVDREPSQHLGPVASDMERNGKASRIGDENRAIANDNRDRANDHAEAARLASEIAREKWKFGQWAEFKRGEISAAQDLARLDLDQKHDRQKGNLERQLSEANGTAKATIRAEVQAIDKRLEAKGMRRVLRDVFGRSRTDRTAREQLSASLADIHQRETEQRQALEAHQRADRVREEARQATNRKRLEKGIETARERREGTRWKPLPPKAKNAPPRITEAENKPLNAPTLAQKKTKRIRPQDNTPTTPLARSWRDHVREDDSSSVERERDAPKRERKPPRPDD